MRFQKTVSLLLFLALMLATSVACKKPPEANTVIEDPPTQAKSYYEFFDTVSVIFSYKGDSAEEFEANCQAVSSLLSEYHRLFDIYYEYEGINNLKTVNKQAGKEPVKVDQKLIEFLLYAKEIHTLTNGATNIAMGSVLTLWHDAREDGMDDPEHAALPNADALTEAARHTDISNLIIDREACTVFLADPAMRLDVGAIGKGYATEKAAQLLISRGVSSYVLNVGGNLRAIGAKPASGNGWVTGITNPDKTSEESFVCKVILKDTSLVTSGDYERFFVVDGKRYHHIIDPKTNQPAAYFSSVSIFTPDSALADALSTALFCMSHEDGLQLIKSLKNVDAIWVTADGTLFKTEGIELYNE